MVWPLTLTPLAEVKQWHLSPGKDWWLTPVKGPSFPGERSCGAASLSVVEL